MKFTDGALSKILMLSAFGSRPHCTDGLLWSQIFISLCGPLRRYNLLKILGGLLPAAHDVVVELVREAESGAHFTEALYITVNCSLECLLIRQLGILHREPRKNSLGLRWLDGIEAVALMLNFAGLVVMANLSGTQVLEGHVSRDNTPRTPLFSSFPNHSSLGLSLIASYHPCSLSVLDTNLVFL